MFSLLLWRSRWRIVEREGAGCTFTSIKMKFRNKDVNAGFENTARCTGQRDNVLILPRKTRIALDDD